MLGIGFGEEHEFERVNPVLGCKGWSKKLFWIKGVLSSQLLSIHSRLGELYFKYANKLLSAVILSHWCLIWFLFDW